MESGNTTTVTHFIILGFPSLQNVQLLLFFMGLVIYLLTLSGHIVIIIIVRIDSRLHNPMYFFLSNFSFLEIWYTSNIIPKMLEVFLQKNKSISYTGCLTQLYFLITLGTAECFILAIMAYDRYLAICHPLRYPILMNSKICLHLALCPWVGAFLVNIPPLVLFCKLPFCGPNKINHFFCDALPLLKLSCMDTHEAEVVDFIVATSVIVSSFLLILVSYVFIIIAVLKIPSTTGRQKAFSTCGSHLAVVTIFYGTLMFMYVRPTSSYSLDSVDFNKVVSLFYTVVTPMLNPIIYCLRNKEVKEALKRAVRVKCALTTKAGNNSSVSLN
ncbi:olfactory receptor 6N1-like [Alligator mississippiensis]|uniref:olfactory receptor 6N1-like n=1 Tax=Alligator mississippiensis TaxID=8496 RepID=UPI0007121210|nr:olfactory receptor 6N1-like [Alligator mississippiensis]